MNVFQKVYSRYTNVHKGLSVVKIENAQHVVHAITLLYAMPMQIYMVDKIIMPVRE